MRRLQVLLLLLFALSALAKPLDLPKPNEKWTSVRVDEFEIIGNASPASIRTIAEDLLQMRELIGQITLLKVRSSLPTTVFVFRNERDFAPYRDALFERKMEHISGMFLGTESGNFILLQADSNSGVDRVVFHELTHYFVRNTVPDLPVWLSEALAEFYSTFGTASKKVLIGRPIKEHVLALREEKLIPLPELFAVTHDSPLYNEDSRSGVFYAQSWAIWHYLMLGNKEQRRAQLPTFLSLLAKGKTADEAFTTAFDTTYEKFEQELRAYVRRSLFQYMTYPMTESLAMTVAEPAPMTYDALLYQLGRVLTYPGSANAHDSERFLTAAIKANPGHAAAHAALGRLYDRTGRADDARAAYDRAVNLGSPDAEVYVLAADSIVQNSQSKENLLRARQLYERATTLDANSAKAWAGLGSTYVLTSDNPAPGIAALEKSLALAPAEEEASVHLAQLYARADRFDEAISLAKRVVQRTTNPSAAKFARDLVARLEEHAVRKLLTTKLNDAISKANSGKNAEALAVMDEILPKISDPAMLAHAQSLRNELAERVNRKKK